MAITLQASLRWALERASDQARTRYNSSGREMLFDKDKEAATGSQWVESPLHYKYTSEGNLVVCSYAIISYKALFATPFVDFGLDL